MQYASPAGTERSRRAGAGVRCMWRVCNGIGCVLHGEEVGAVRERRQQPERCGCGRVAAPKAVQVPGADVGKSPDADVGKSRRRCGPSDRASHALLVRKRLKRGTRAMPTPQAAPRAHRSPPHLRRDSPSGCACASSVAAVEVATGNGAGLRLCEGQAGVDRWRGQATARPGRSEAGEAPIAFVSFGNLSGDQVHEHFVRQREVHELHRVCRRDVVVVLDEQSKDQSISAAACARECWHCKPERVSMRTLITGRA